MAAPPANNDAVLYGSLGFLPVDIRCVVIEAFAFSRARDFRVLSALSRSFLNMAMSILRDGNSKFWKSEFEANDHFLCECVSFAREERITWREGVRDFLAIKSFSLLEKPTCTIGGEHVYADVVLYNHPSNGLLLNIAQWDHLIIVNCLRSAEGVLSSAGVLSRSFGLPVLTDSEQFPPQGLQGEASLVVVSVNGRPITEFGTFEVFVDIFKNIGVFCHFRFLYVPNGGLGTLPRNFSIEPRDLPASVVEYRTLRQGMLMREGDLDDY
mmetsp:Transcript_20387/g.46068  ORF Transcript_20387/g.46068 Transcript_20387/m.46068 type:complete len:268 (-) Transcript_20387:201-1004(-)